MLSRRVMLSPFPLPLAAGVIWLTAAAPLAASDVLGPMPPRPPHHAASSAVFVEPLPAGRHERPHQHRPSHACAACRGDCRGGACPAQCPVRPDEFGFYETQWRTWPGTGGVRQVNLEAVTPVSPPRSEVPPVDQESRALPPAEAEPSADAVLPLPQPVPDRQPPREPRPPAAPEEPDAPQKPEPPEPRAPEKRAPEKDAPAAPKEEEENLFEEATRRLPRAELLAVIRARATARAVGDGVVPVAHTDPVANDAAHATVQPANPLRTAAGGRSTNPLR